MARIRIFSPFFPYPHKEAAYQFIFNQVLNCVELGHSVELVTWKDSAAEFAQKFESAKQRWPAGATVVHWPNAQESGLARVARVLRSLISKAASPELFYYNPQWDRRSELEAVDLEIYHYSFSHLWLKSSRGNARKNTVQFHNLEHRLFEIRAADESGLRAALHLQTAAKLKIHETELPKLVDEIWQISPVDVEDFSHQASGARQRLVTPSIDPKSLERRWSTPQPFDDVVRLGYVGGLDFTPNKEGMRWIVKNFAPLLRGQRIEILHAGKSDPATEQIAAEFPFIKFLGFVDDLEAWWASLSYTLVPDTTGAGVRVKLLESLGSKVPVLATRLATERLPRSLDSETGLTSSDSAEDWIRKVTSSRAFVERQRLREYPFPEGLLGRNIFSFLTPEYFR